MKNSHVGWFLGYLVLVTAFCWSTVESALDKSWQYTQENYSLQKFTHVQKQEIDSLNWVIHDLESEIAFMQEAYQELHLRCDSFVTAATKIKVLPTPGTKKGFKPRHLTYPEIEDLTDMRTTYWSSTGKINDVAFVYYIMEGSQYAIHKKRIYEWDNFLEEVLNLDVFDRIAWHYAEGTVLTELKEPIQLE